MVICFQCLLSDVSFDSFVSHPWVALDKAFTKTTKCYCKVLKGKLMFQYAISICQHFSPVTWILFWYSLPNVFWWKRYIRGIFGRSASKRETTDVTGGHISIGTTFVIPDRKMVDRESLKWKRKSEKQQETWQLWCHSPLEVISGYECFQVTVVWAKAHWHLTVTP